jgi:cytochrome c2
MVWRYVLGLCLVGAFGAQTALAQVPAIFKDADLKLGEKLIADSKCVQCHQQKVGRRQRYLQAPGPHQYRRVFARHGGAMQHRTEPRAVSRRRERRSGGAKPGPLPF